MNGLPLHGLVVLEFSQYLSAPSAGLRLADLGARVIKIERPVTGDAGRKLAIKNLWVGEDSLLFHTINRNKESFTADMKDPQDLDILKKLIAKADIIIHNFRPGVMEKNGLGYEAVQQINPAAVYAAISGYGNTGSWKNKPGQDLLLQSIAGLAFTTGNAAEMPMPFGLAIGDILAGAQLVQGILAAIVSREKTGHGSLIEISLLETLIDFQFELLTTFFASNQQPQRSQINSGHTLLSAPYGIYKTADGYLALAMMPLQELAEAIDCHELKQYSTADAFEKRDAIKKIIAGHLHTKPGAYWLQQLRQRDLWAAEVLNWQQLKGHEAYRLLAMEQVVGMNGSSIVTTRCPLKLNGKTLTSNRPAPALGVNTKEIISSLINGSVHPIAETQPVPKTEEGNLLSKLLVVDFSQFLSGPYATLRLADLGAEVIKIEKTGTGDICRNLYVSDVKIEGESTIFHAINRNKKSYQANLKDEQELQQIKALISKADVLVHNFRPGVMERLGLSYETVKEINPAIVYAEISGYGTEGPWKDLPGQDLLLQAVSGLTWLSNNDGENPTPMGVAVVDMLAGTHLAQGILAAIYQKQKTGEGSLVQVSMLESILDFQFEVLTCFYNDGHQLPQRSSINNAHAYVAAPYGIYQTKDSYLSLAMTDIVRLGELTGCAALTKYTDKREWFSKRDEIKQIIAGHLRQETNAHWLSILEKADVWCAPVFNYEELIKQEAFRNLDMVMPVKTGKGFTLDTTRCPIRVDGKILRSAVGAPLLGEHTALISKRYNLQEPFITLQ
jgi:crotonobetainyl-CoA:carnitine CoA-transferase CaiB-like acyl-CoA transferase